MTAPRFKPDQPRILRSPEEFSSILPEWKSLFSRCPGATPFQHPDWLMAWIRAFQPQELVGLEIRESGRLVAFAPLLIFRRKNERVLAFAGGGVSDYLGCLVEPDRESLVAAEFLNTVQKTPGWDVLDLTDVSSNNFLLQFDPLKLHVREHDLCFVLSLPSSSAELRQSLSKRQWANLRNARSRMQREGEALVEIATPSNAGSFLDELFRLHTNRWLELGQNGVLGDPHVQQFHSTVAPGLVGAGLLRLYRLTMNERTLAVVYCFFHNRAVYCYLQGFDPEARHLSPGTQLMFFVIEDAVQQGAQRFDFLRGEEGYKLHWRPAAEPTFRIEVSRNVLASGLARTA